MYQSYFCLPGQHVA